MHPSVIDYCKKTCMQNIIIMLNGLNPTKPLFLQRLHSYVQTPTPDPIRFRLFLQGPVVLVRYWLAFVNQVFIFNPKNWEKEKPRYVSEESKKNHRWKTCKSSQVTETILDAGRIFRGEGGGIFRARNFIRIFSIVFRRRLDLK